MRTLFMTASAVFLIDLAGGLSAGAQQPSVGLEPMKVTATRQEEEVLTIPAHVTVIDREAIKNSNASDIGDLLKSEAGLWVDKGSSSNPSEIFIDARGFNSGGSNASRMIVLIDGQRANRSDLGTPDWSVVPIESIERIEIMRGSATALYGDNAMSGSINIITKKGAIEPEILLSTDYR
jgi:iron complex outermembrane recepter protein